MRVFIVSVGEAGRRGSLVALEGKQKSGIQPRGRLTPYSVAVKKHHDQGNSSDIKESISGAQLTVSEG